MDDKNHVVEGEKAGSSASARRELKKAIVLARGLGKRMRAPIRSAHIASEQVRAAEAGMKAMIPVSAGGRFSITC